MVASLAAYLQQLRALGVAQHQAADLEPDVDGKKELGVEDAATFR